MPHGMTDQEYISYLAKRSQEPDIQALVASWGPPTTEQLALIARVFGGTRRASSTDSSESRRRPFGLSFTSSG